MAEYFKARYQVDDFEGSELELAFKLDLKKTCRFTVFCTFLELKFATKYLEYIVSKLLNQIIIPN